MRSSNYLFTILVLLLFACEGKMGPAGKNSLVKISDEPIGANCSNGGVKIETGIDQDADGVLSSSEVNLTKYVCKGDNGKNSLINVTPETAGVNCSKGGLKIEIGLDNNGNNNLDVNEITQTKFVCNGQNGLSTLTTYTDELPGTNCGTGGFKIQTGVDTNSDLVLGANEIQSTKYLCLPVGDKQIRLELGESNVGTNSTDWFNTPWQTFRLIKFNKLNYASVDSITFVPSMYTPDASNKVFVELYNWTDGVSIATSQISSNTADYIFKESRNIYQLLPNKEITLGIRLKSESSNYYVSTGIRSYLFIYKH